MEIGHNVMHGQWDWMNDPQIHSSKWDWDTASTKEAWKHSHNYIHHTYTNIRGKDKDLGYEIMRIDPHQPWHPVYLAQPFYNALLMMFFEWGVALHDLDFDAIRAGEKSKKQALKELKGIAGKARAQIQKDYVAWPLLSGLAMAALDVAINARSLGQERSRRQARPRAQQARPRPARPPPAHARGRRWRSRPRAGLGAYRSTVWANVTANIVRNLWAHSIIFCGHFPDQTYTFSQEETEDESRGAFYVRQLVGAANIEGGAFFHVASGNLGYQVEHHLFPDMPSTRYAEIAPQVKEICERYGLPYNSGPLSKQLGWSTARSSGWRSPAASRGPSPAPTRATTRPTRSSNGHGRSQAPGPRGLGPGAGLGRRAGVDSVPRGRRVEVGSPDAGGSADASSTEGEGALDLDPTQATEVGELDNPCLPVIERRQLGDSGACTGEWRALPEALPARDERPVGGARAQLVRDRPARERE